MAMNRHQFLTICLLSSSSAFATVATNNSMIYMGFSDTFEGGSDTIKGHLGATSNQINRDVGDVPGNRYNGDFNFNYHRNNNDELERKFELSALVNDESLTMWSLQEAYLNKKGVFRSYDPASKTGDQMKFGRQVLPWSTIDSTWGFGKLNNRKNFDGFEPGQEGLVGVGYENKSSSGFYWKLFASGIYVPEMNPGLDINKGDETITSRNPWADAPAPTTNIDDNETRIRYIVDYPQIDEVIYRYSIGLNMGWENKHWAADGFFMRKPENTQTPNVEVALAENAESVKAFITPEFYYHDVFGGNLKYRNADVEVYLSAIGIFPNTFPDGNETATTYTEIKTEKRREAYAGGGIQKINDIYGMGFNYVARLSPFDRDADSLAQDPRWNQAVNAFLSRTFKRTYKISADVKYDMLTTDRLVMLRAGYKVSKALLMSLGVNMIGTPNSGKSYWSPYTNNDAIYAGLRYVY